MLPGETPWDLEQRLKSTIREANMSLTDSQHRTWFVASLTPHLRTTLSQQNISTQAEALEIVMRLHETPIQDPGLGVQQIQAQMQNLCLEMKKLKQEQAPRPEVQEEVWCIKCRSQGHNKDHRLILANYVVMGGPTPLQPEAHAGPSETLVLWCVICEIGGKHTTNNCHLLQKYTTKPKKLFCNFCRSMGHDECTCRSYQLMKDQIPPCQMQIEMRGLDPVEGMACTEFQGRGRGRGGMGPGRGH